MIDANVLMPAALAYAGVSCFVMVGRALVTAARGARLCPAHLVMAGICFGLGLGCILALLAAAWVGKPGWI